MKFMASQRRRQTDAYFLMVKQLEDESLMGYLTLFNKMETNGEKRIVGVQSHKHKGPT